jgi:hypothetical protein
LQENERPNCFKCKYFYITWDKNFPNGCRIYGIKTRHIPSVVVLQATGEGCLGFDEKARKTDFTRD